ncbi:MAG: hypothetical protein A2172_04580 [Candidatus Woykebacteria bacterium RBG_13_40_15]|uniref:Uncharacterized protein n=1 Tax=Candidatus Woykebacteria bacterium RBG_13_40_15 TaxID=1802593 RepID=A0A1G1W709_9BACT|nr:MAG: hypothetical protein A2172_04580 [Candidatus Woykebacteria bacterium RBG_13_40_15]
MPKELKPAHEAVITSIKTHCENLKGIEPAMARGGVRSGGRFMSAEELERGRLQEIGGLCSQLRTLEAMIILEEALPWVIQELEQLDYRHAAISVAIDSLNERLS